MPRIQDLKLAHAMILAVVAPAIAAIVFSYQLARENLSELREFEAIERMVVLAGHLSDLVHEQQRERGATAVFLNSEGRRFAEVLAGQRLDTDARRAALETALAGFDVAGAGPRFAADLAALQDRLSRLGSIRREVDAQGIPLGAALEYYTGSNALALSLVSRVAEVSADPDVVMSVLGYVSFLQAKERAGIERAVGAASFAVGRFTPVLMNRFEELVSAQKLYHANFLAHAPDAQRARFEEMMQGPAAREVERLREIAFRGGLEGALEGTDAATWFDAISEKINALHAFEDLLTEDLRALAESRRAAAERGLTLVTVTCVLALFVCGIVSAILLGGLSRGMRQVLRPMQEMSEGNLDVALPPERRNEIGAIVRALEVFRANARARLEEERAAERRRELRAQQLARRAEQTERLRSSLRAAVEAGQAGDFSVRVDIAFEEDELRTLAQSVNRLLASVEAGIDEVVVMLRAMSNADLTHRITGDRQGAFAELRDGANATATRLSAFMSEIGAAVRGALGGARGINDGAIDLAARSESQAASLQQTAATMEQLAATVRSNSVALREAESLAGGMTETSRSGEETVNRAVEAVGRIEQNSMRITDIISVIQAIAFQTNLLALNAAVEAARAGEAGKGFAVVASEVRELAQRSSDAARDITELIRESTVSVADGVRLVADTGQALSAINVSIAELSSNIRSVSEAGQEQNRGIEEISQSIASLDNITQQNAQLSDKSVSLARGLSDQIGTLSDSMSRFRLIEEPAARDASPRAA
ncbi:methyl-accepting chemotaxis protein [Oceanicella sp. SM1341]|uniref:methyl-accepting chemotaxis protein n=1 Tax=Oceanicella sp. SM1341 TaxID=1548889 RepID=UPI000E5354D6|nr:nitrate- and nitrite sensing domain-containing protein [Oceanicella sp. SM1341]